MSGRSGAARVALAALAGSLALALPGPARAATYEASVSPSPFSFAPSGELVYRLQVTTGAAPEQVVVSAGPGPAFPGNGYALKLQAMSLEGPGTVVSSSGIYSIADRFCAPAFPDIHGNASYFSPRITVDLPAGSTSTIVLPARFYGDAPWRGMDLSVEFEVGADPVSAQRIRSPSPLNGGPHGLPIALQTVPAGGAGGACLEGVVRGTRRTLVQPGTDVLVRGRTDPAVAGHVLTIRGARLGESGPRELARVRVGADGAFAYRWRPDAPGEWAVGALYRSQSVPFTDDFSQAQSLSVVTPPPRVSLLALTVAHRVRCRGARCVILTRGSLRRPRSARGVACTGRVRLRVAGEGRRLVSSTARVGRTCRYRMRRRFRLRLARTRALTARVSYLGDATFAPKRGRAHRIRLRR